MADDVSTARGGVRRCNIIRVCTKKAKNKGQGRRARLQVSAHAAEVGRGGALLEGDADPQDEVRALHIGLHRVKHVVRGDHVRCAGAGQGNPQGWLLRGDPSVSNTSSGVITSAAGAGQGTLRVVVIGAPVSATASGARMNRPRWVTFLCRDRLETPFKGGQPACSALTHCGDDNIGWLQ